MSGEPVPGASPIIPEGLDETLVLLRHGETEWILRGLFQGQGIIDQPANRGRIASLYPKAAVH